MSLRTHATHSLTHNTRPLTHTGPLPPCPHHVPHLPPHSVSPSLWTSASPWPGSEDRQPGYRIACLWAHAHGAGDRTLAGEWHWVARGCQGGWARTRRRTAEHRPSIDPHRWQTRAKFIYKATKQHALNLAKFVSIYKTTLLLQRRLAHGGKETQGDTFWAGLVGGWIVFGNRNAVNEQVSRKSGGGDSWASTWTCRSPSVILDWSGVVVVCRAVTVQVEEDARSSYPGQECALHLQTKLTLFPLPA